MRRRGAITRASRFDRGPLVIALAALLAAGSSQARDYSEEREACRQREPMRLPLFGDTHVHTVYSFDANGQDTRNSPRDAYRFARGEKVGLQPYAPDGTPTRSAQLRRPLDFTVLSDHAELLGEVRMCSTPGTPSYGSDFCFVNRMARSESFSYLAVRNLMMRHRFEFCGAEGALCLEQAGIVWQDIQAAAEEAYDRTAECSFTSFVGYEWTASVGNGENLHRNVVFRNAKVPALPPSWVETSSAFELWQHLEQECVRDQPGCEALTIPHNSNLSGPGLMFASARLTGPDDIDRVVDKEEAARRQRWEPLVEIMQHKGDSECLPGASNDELCGFEKLPYNSFAGVARVERQGVNAALGRDLATLEMAPDARAFVRNALLKGLVLEGDLGVNPLKYGVIASTDTHTGTPGLVAEDDAKGHGGAGSRNVVGLPDDLEFNPGGLAVVWAEENSRDAIFEAMQRRETYGTSGTRPVVRFFGGWDLAESMCEGDDFAAQGYSKGVPMGGELTSRSKFGGDPRFAVWALQDPGTDASPGTALQRIQIVKGWVEDGAPREKVIDVAGGANDASVDLQTCEPQGSGSAQLCSVWRDRDFDPSQRAFYYARVLENPSCRWSQHLCVDAGVDCTRPETITPGFEACCVPDHEPVIQERAWTSPIWYTP
jgi:hypothetical protein